MKDLDKKLKIIEQETIDEKIIKDEYKNNV